MCNQSFQNEGLNKLCVQNGKPIFGNVMIANENLNKTIYHSDSK